MNSNYFRITYNDIGIYEALKKYLCNNKFSFNDWLDFKKSEDVNWLNVPPTYNKNSYSYFTESGFKIFMEKTYPLITKYLKVENIKMEKYTFDTKKVKLNN